MRSARSARPSVSVVLPTHNRPAWLEQALTSVLDGEYDDVEVIVSNNGRPEHTRALAERIVDPRIRFVERPPCDMLENFLSALTLARGEYVAALHDDDWWHPRLLATLVPALATHRDVVAAFTDPWLVTREGHVDPHASDYFSRSSGRATLAGGPHHPFVDLAVRETIALQGTVFRRDAVSPASFPPQVGAALDLWMGYLLAATGGAAHFCPERLVYCRLHPNSDFALGGMENLAATIYCQRRMLADPRITPHRGELRRRLAARQRFMGASLLRQGSRSAGRSHLSAALALRPTAKGLGAWAASWLVPSAVLGRL